MDGAHRYIEALREQGKYHFTTAEAVAALGESLSRVRAELRRLKAEGEVVDPHRSFHVIVPHEQRACGCLPAQELVPPLMGHLHAPYYVALLSASEMYGVPPLQDHPFQVMAKVSRKPIECGHVHLRLLGRKDFERTPLLEKRTTRGALPVASPEATALELVGYVNQCGGFANVAAMLAALVSTLDPQKLIAMASFAPIAWLQRLGYLLDATDNRSFANALAPVVQERALDFAPLLRAKPTSGVTRLARWKLALNATIEPNSFRESARLYQ
jgi:predicted transcriptional regulator of viral defense system